MNIDLIPGVTLICVVLLEAVVAWLTPRWTPEGFAFGVPVSAQWRASAESRRIERGFRFRALLGAGAGVITTLAVTLLGWTSAIAAPPLIALVGMFWGYGWAHRRAWPYATPSPGPDVILARPGGAVPAVGSPWAQLAPFGLLAAAALYLGARWSELPARFPIHWNAVGEIDGWGTRNPVTVFLPLGVGAVICAGLYLLLRATVRWSRRGAPGPAAQRVAVQRRMVVIAVFASEGLVAAIHAGLSLLPLVRDPRVLVFGALVLTALFAFALPLWMSAMARRLPRGEAAAAARAPGDLRHWKWGLLYANREDPAVFVEKRFGLGYTVNLANPLAWLLFALLLLPALLAPLVVHLTAHR